MAARAAESHYIPGEGDAISVQMFKVTVKMIEQTLQENASTIPVVEGRTDDALAWLKSRPTEIAQACGLRSSGDDGDNRAATAQLNEKMVEACFDALERLAAAGRLSSHHLNGPQGHHQTPRCLPAH